MGEYTVEFKIEVIDMWKKYNLTEKEIVNKYNISTQTLARWLKEYDAQGIEGLVLKPKNKHYTGEFKQAVVEDMRTNNLSQNEVSQKYLVGRSQVQLWERIYLEQGAEGLYIENRGRPLNSIQRDKKITLNKSIEEDLISENQRLRMENDYLKKLNALIQTKEK